MMTKEIDRVRKELTAWRKSHGGRLRGVPRELRQCTAELLRRHPWSDVTRRVGISNSTLSAWCRAGGVDARKRRKDTRSVGSGSSAGRPPRTSTVGAKTGAATPQTTFAGKKETALASFVQVDPGVVRAAAMAGQSVVVELQTPRGVSIRIRGSVDASMICGLVRSACDAEGGCR